MDTLSFSLGISFVAIIVIAIVAVYAFVKVRRIREELNDIRRDSEMNISEIYRSINEHIQQVNRVLDSRLDKLESRLNNKK